MLALPGEWGMGRDGINRVSTREKKFSLLLVNADYRDSCIISSRNSYCQSLHDSLTPRIRIKFQKTIQVLQSPNDIFFGVNKLPISKKFLPLRKITIKKSCIINQMYVWLGLGGFTGLK